MVEEKPIVYLLRGDDREAIESHIHTFYNGLGDMADMNTSRLDGKSIDLNDLRSASLALPFLSERRLVVVEDALLMITGGSAGDIRAEFLELLDSLPQSTALVLVIPDTQKNQKRKGFWQSYWNTLGERHWLIQWQNNVGSRALIVDCPLPNSREMANWIRKKADDLQGSFTPQAAQILAEFLGSDTQRATQEIIKLLTYVNFERPVDDDDVRRLSVQDRQSDIFSLVDAIGSRDGKKAQELLHLLLEEMIFIQLFSMVIRQFRLILGAREIIDTGGDEKDVGKLLGLHGFVARKISAQAKLFTLPALESIYHQLLEIDLDEKTGGMDGDVALDIFIARLAQGQI